MSPEVRQKEQHRHKDLFGWQVWDGSRFLGELEYYYEPDGSGVCLFSVDVGRASGQGLGRLLVETFIKQVGRGIALNGPIIHAETLQQILRGRLLNHVEKGANRFQYREVYDLAIVRFLESCGIRVDSIVINYDPLDHEFTVRFFGST